MYTHMQMHAHENWLHQGVPHQSFGRGVQHMMDLRFSNLYKILQNGEMTDFDE